MGDEAISRVRASIKGMRTAAAATPRPMTRDQRMVIGVMSIVTGMIECAIDDDDVGMERLLRTLHGEWRT